MLQSGVEVSSNYIPRIAQSVLLRLAQSNPVVGLTGPRQSGKTTLARHVFPDLPYVNLEAPETRTIAQEDPRRFLHTYADGAVFDEIQRVPELFSYLQVHVDEKIARAPYILSGSSQFTLNRHVTQSLAGRIGLLHLLPFSHAELHDAALAPSTLEQAIYKGGYPPIFDRNADPQQWYGDYATTYVERDVRQLSSIADLDAFQRFVTLCAHSIGQLLNLTRLAADCGITANTAKAWIGLLRESYIVHVLRPHHENLRKRLVKMPKLYFVDTGLAARLLGLHTSEQLLAHSMRGPLFENWVITELLKGRFNRGLRDNLFFWRTHAGLEIDILADRSGKFLPIECKSGMTTASDWFDNLQTWQTLAGDRSEHPHLIYGGQLRHTRHDIEVLPWSQIDELAAWV